MGTCGHPCLQGRVEEQRVWGNLPIHSTTTPAHPTRTAAFLAAEVLQIVQFQTQQSGSMNQNFFLISSTYRWIPQRQESHPLVLLLFRAFFFFPFLFFSNLVFYSPFAPLCTKPAPSESAIGQKIVNQSWPGPAAGWKLFSQEEKEPAATSSPCVPSIAALNRSLVFTLQHYKIQRGISNHND